MPGLPADQGRSSTPGRPNRGQHSAKGYNVFGDTHCFRSLRTRVLTLKLNPEPQDPPKNRQRIRSRRMQHSRGAACRISTDVKVSSTLARTDWPNFRAGPAQLPGRTLGWTSKVGPAGSYAAVTRTGSDSKPRSTLCRMGTGAPSGSMVAIRSASCCSTISISSRAMGWPTH